MDMITIKSKALALVQKNGPVLPIKICNELKITTIFAGAILSDLIGSGKVKISSAKIGSSPIYYVQGQEEKLEVLYSHLKEPEKKAYDLLKENKILEDAALTPLQRVALREIKDFAIPLNLTTGQLFWKFHLINNSEAEALIKSYLSLPEIRKEEIRPAEEKTIEPKKEEFKQETPVQKEIEKKKEIKETKREEILEKENIKEKKVEEEAFLEKPSGKIKEEQTKLEPGLKGKKEHKPRKETKTKAKKYSVSEIANYLDGREMKVLNEEVIKSSEYNFNIQIKSQLGMLKYLLKFSSKKSVSDKDLILAQHEASAKKLPLIYLSPGKLSEKAKKYSEANNILVEKYG